jgi:16S rRNA (guanine527-N7)-methyltransferase
VALAATGTGAARKDFSHRHLAYSRPAAPGYTADGSGIRVLTAAPAQIETRLGDGLEQLGITLVPDQASALLRFLSLLQKWNRAFNLTALTDPDDMVVRHILDSAAARPFLAGETVLDVGTGAGLPGIPLALIDPGRQFTLLDASGKKIRFLRQVLLEIALPNVRLVQARVDAYRPEAPFGTVICRAFSTLADFARAGGRLAGPGGRLVALKGRRPDAELKGLPAPWAAREMARVQVPFLDAERHIVVLERAA